jgi:hypothetical protein
MSAFAAIAARSKLRGFPANLVTQAPNITRELMSTRAF